MTAIYLAIIGDIVGSREAEHRELLQARLDEHLDRANDDHAECLASRFVLTLGDEFQGLLTSPQHLPQLMAQIRASLHPAELRFGLGVGPLDTALRQEALGMDGPCFHRARRAIERARGRATPLEVEVPADEPALEVYSLLYGELRAGWTDRQRQVYDLADSGLDGRTIADRLDISPSAVSQHLKATGRKRIVPATRAWLAVISSHLPAAQTEPKQ